MPLNDHVLLLQLERATEALEERVSGIEEPEDYCDCNCHEDETDGLHQDIRRLDDDFEKLDERVAEIEKINGLVDVDSRVIALQARVDELELQLDNCIRMFKP